MNTYFQVGRGLHWSRLYKSKVRAHRALAREISKDAKGSVKWRRAGQKVASPNEANGANLAATAIIQDAIKRGKDTTYKTSAGAKFRVFYANPPAVPSVPALAKVTPSFRKTAKFWTEMHVVYHDQIKSLGLYVPRTLKDGSGYYSEHAWASALDWGMSNGRGGYEQGPKLYPFLKGVNTYITRNFVRLGVDKTIFDGKQWYGPDKVLPYTGSDKHDTHTHTQFANHAGRKPPWV